MNSDKDVHISRPDEMRTPTFARVNVAGSCHFGVPVAFATIAGSRSELLASTAGGRAGTPRAPIAPAAAFHVVAGALARAVRIADPRLVLAECDFHGGWIGYGRFADESEASLQVATVFGRSVGRDQPRRPWAHLLYLRAGLGVANFVVHLTARALESSILWGRIVALATPDFETTSAQGTAFAPRSIWAPAAIDRRLFG
jgi:hypothetical protein